MKDDKESEKYKKFNGKKVITCIFSLDMEEPYYIDWTSESGINFIKENEGDILVILYDSIIEKYKSDHGIIYKFYSYWREFCPDNEKKPINFIRFLKNKIVNFKVPKYIEDFFTKIEFQIEMTNGKNNKELIFINLDTKDNFLEALEKELKKTVKNYLNIIFDGEDEEDD
jgi:hypothetical protein